jgi:hypothetical protein
MVINENVAFGISQDKDELERRKNATDANAELPWYLSILSFLGLSSCC